MQGKTENIDERLKRIEIMIDKLQASIIGQVGNYGRNIEDLKQEIIATQDSFSKIINPLSENLQELRKITSGTPVSKKTVTTVKKPTKSKTKKAGKSKDGFESYLRG